MYIQADLTWTAERFAQETVRHLANRGWTRSMMKDDPKTCSYEACAVGMWLPDDADWVLYNEGGPWDDFRDEDLAKHIPILAFDILDELQWGHDCEYEDMPSYFKKMFNNYMWEWPSDVE